MGCNGMAFFPSNFMVQNPHDQEDQQHHHPPTSLNSLIPSSCTPHHQVDLHGVASILAGKRSMSFTGFDMGEDQVNGGEDDYSDDGSQVGEKKRRLNMEQVRTLEKNFELGNKLEPERKMQLARALGLQPRQIAIWFQNRRARWKTKQLEKDYDILKRQFEAIKADNDLLQTQNKKLQSEILALKTRSSEQGGHEYIINLNKETDQQGSSSNGSENSSEINLDISRSTPPSIDSPSLSSPHHQTRPPSHTTTTTLFPSSNLIRPTAVAQLLQNSSRLSSDFQQQQQYLQTKMEPTTVQDDQNFTNMFCGIDDQPNFWPWQEQQHFH